MIVYWFSYYKLVCRPKTSGTNVERKWSSFLKVSILFQGRCWLWFYDCVMYVCLASLWYMYVCECCIIDHTCCKWDRWMMNTMSHDLIVWSYINVIVIVACWMDRVLHSNTLTWIGCHVPTTFRHKLWIGYHIPIW